MTLDVSGRRGTRRLFFAALAAIVLTLVATGLALAATPPPLVTPTAGVSIYDLTGKLSATDRSDLQARANKLIQAGADPVVYLEPYGADRTTTRDQANQLIARWKLPSNNVVIFVNLDPAGQQSSVVLLAGDKYHATGALDDSHEQSIIDAQILPAFKRGDYHGGLAAGLDAVYQRITTVTSTGPAGPTDPRPLLSFVLIVGLIIWGVVVATRARRPLFAGYAGAGSGAMPNDDLAPALVGTLVHGKASDRDVRATILQMSTEGALDIEPIDDRSVQLRLRDKSQLSETWELLTWESLANVADQQQVVSATALERASHDWSAIADTIDSELRQRGYRTRADAQPAAAFVVNLTRERIALIAGGALMFIGLIAIAIPGLREIWFLLLALGAGAVIWGVGEILRAIYVSEQAKSLPPDLTPLGIQACAAWHDYAERVRQRRITQVDPTRLTLYAPVLDCQEAILPWLITSARMGFVPSWLSQGMHAARTQNVALSPFYVYWLALFQGYVDPALIQPLAEDPKQLTREDFAQPVGGIAPAPFSAIPFIYPIGFPIYTPLFFDEPEIAQGGDWDSGGGGGNWGSGDSGGGGGDWGGGGGDSGGGGGDFGGGGGDFGGGGGNF